MAPLNSHYSQTDYARAVLRMAIKSANITTDEIISRHLYRAAFVPDGYGSYTIDSSLADNIKYNPFNATKKTLNDAFFNSTMNTAPGSVITQAYTMLGISGDPIEAARIDLEYNENSLNISNIIKHILVDFHNSKNNRARQVAASIYEGKTPKAEGLEKIKQIDKEKIVGENYHDLLARAGYKPLAIEEYKKLIDISNSKSGKVVEFMDIYTMYHYYIYRKAINNHFLDYVKRNPGLTAAEKKSAFERIAIDQIKIHCNSPACPENAFFNRDNMRLCPYKMSLDKSQKLVLELDNATHSETREICDTIQEEVMADNPNYQIVIKDIHIEPEYSNNHTNNVLFVNLSSGCKKLVSDSSAGAVIENPDASMMPQIYPTKPHVVYDSAKDRAKAYFEGKKHPEKEPTPPLFAPPPPFRQLTIDEVMRKK